MRIAEGVEALELTMNVAGSASTIHPTLVWDDTHAILIDTGVPGLVPAIEAAMAQAGVPFARLDKVILTHQDIDHIGSLPALLQAASRPIEVLAHEVEKPYIEGEKPLIKFNPERMAKLLEALPPAERQRMQSALSAPPKAPVNTPLHDGQFLPYCGGITVIHTPGHTPGHISLYLHASKTLVTGDALTAADGRVQGPNPQATPDLQTAWRSLQKLTHFDIQTAICYHGGVCRQDAGAQLAALAATAS